MKIAFTGHRPNKLNNDYDLSTMGTHFIKMDIFKAVNEYLRENNIKGLENFSFIVGGALGIDTLVALSAIEWGVKFTLAVPCANQDKMWPQKSKNIYLDIMSKADTVHYVSKDAYNNTCMQKRNEWMVDNCDVLIAVWDGSNGGTKNCIDYAVKQGKKIIYIKI